MQQQTLRVDKFSGLNTRDAPGRIEDSEMIECQNFDIGRDGELVKRSGIKTIATVGAGNTYIHPIGYFLTNTYNQIIIAVGDNLYYTSDGLAFTLIGNYPHVQHGIQYTDKFYLVRDNDIMLQWDGTTMTTITSSPSGTHCRVYKDRLFVCNSLSATNPSRVYYSSVADFSTAGWAGLSTFFDVQPGDGDICVAFAVLHDILVVFKEYSTWLLYVVTDPTAWELRNSHPEIGCVSKYTPREIEGFLYFVGPRGTYRTDGYTFTDIAEPVSPVFRNQVIFAQTLNQTSAAWWEDKYIILLQSFVTAPTWGALATSTWDSLALSPWDSANATYTWLVYHIRTGKWSHWLPAAAEALIAYIFIEVRGPSVLKGLYMGSRINDGKLYRYGDSTYLDGNGTAYDCVVETKDFDFEQPTATKRGLWVSVERAGAGNVSVAHITDGNTQSPKVLTFPDSVRRALRAPGTGFFRTWRIRATSTHDGPVTFYGFTLATTARQKTLAGK